MHGLLASNEAMSHAAAWIANDFPGIYILNVEIGNGRDDSLLIDINKQVDMFAAIVKNDTNLKKGFSLIGHSQVLVFTLLRWLLWRLICLFTVFVFGRVV